MLVIAVIFLTAGIAALVLGLRGRRIGDHPICRKCRYNLTGRPDDRHRCSECGADLSRSGAIRIGQRRCRYRLVVSGIALIVPSLGLIGFAGWAGYTNWDPIPHEPNWLLTWNIDGTQHMWESLKELDTRNKAGRVSAQQLNKAADLVLARMTIPPGSSEDTNQSVHVGLNDFVEDAYESGRLDPARWVQYTRQGISFELDLTPKSIRRGALLLLSPEAFDTRYYFDHEGFAGTIGVTDVLVDGVKVRVIGSTQSIDHRQNQGWFTVGAWDGPAPSVANDAAIDVRQLAAGSHQLKATIVVKVFKTTTKWTSGQQENHPDELQPPLLSETITITDTFTVLPYPASDR